jgi:hypothetical protein
VLAAVQVLEEMDLNCFMFQTVRHLLHILIYSNKLRVFNIRSQKQSTEGTVAKKIETDYKSAV